jgi:hypothetical protein
MDNWLANMVDDVDSLHVEIDNFNDPLVGFCFIRSIDMYLGLSTDTFHVLQRFFFLLKWRFDVCVCATKLIRASKKTSPAQAHLPIILFYFYRRIPSSSSPFPLSLHYAGSLQNPSRMEGNALALSHFRTRVGSPLLLSADATSAARKSSGASFTPPFFHGTAGCSVTRGGLA